MYIPRNPSNCILDFFGLIVRVGSLFIRYLRITSVLFFVCLFVSGLFYYKVTYMGHWRTYDTDAFNIS